MHAFTAAHRSLPFGTRVLVTNVKNDRTVEVRINDRGPFIRGRILDLSYAAARELDPLRRGVPGEAPRTRRGGRRTRRLVAAGDGRGRARWAGQRAVATSSGSTSSGPIHSMPARAPLTAATSTSTRSSGRASPAMRHPRLDGQLFANHAGP